MITQPLVVTATSWSSFLQYTTLHSVDIFIVLDTLADQLDTTKRFGDHTVAFISEYKNRVTKRHEGDCMVLVTLFLYSLMKATVWSPKRLVVSM